LTGIRAKFSGEKSEIENVLTFLRKECIVIENSHFKTSDIPGEVFIYVIISRKV